MSWFKVPEHTKTQEFYRDLSDGRVSRGVFGKIKRFDPTKIASRPSVSRFFVDRIKNYVRPTMDVLDLGCGPGGFLAVAAPLCRTIVGVDISPAFVAECGETIRRNQLANARVMEVGPLSLPFPDSSFDAVIMVDTIHHVEDPVPVLLEVYRVLKPGGVFLVFEPNILNPLLLGMCIFDRNEWGVLSLGTKSRYRELLGAKYEFLEVSYNCLLIGPESWLFLRTAELLDSRPWSQVFGWLSPKIFIAAIQIPSS